MASNHKSSHTSSISVIKTGDGHHIHGPPPFAWCQLWKPAVVNPINLKSYTIPIFNLTDPYAQSFHLSWIGFFVAFLSWFAFPPLMPEAIKADLKLSDAQVANSNIIAICATLAIRLFVGPIVDRYGPRKVMACILIIGAIPSGLAGTAHDASTLYTLRFFIGILGASFVPCQAWTSAFFDKNCVGTANALVGGWGNMGGGATFAIMTSLYESLRDRGLTQHTAWRASFAVVPAPILLTVAVAVLIFGRDHPAGKWSERHDIPATVFSRRQGDHTRDLESEKHDLSHDKEENKVTVENTTRPDEDTDAPQTDIAQSTLDIAVNEPLTFKAAVNILASPVTWLPVLAYMTTFGFELMVDGGMATVLFSLFNGRMSGFDQKKAGYYTAIFGLMNFVTRPLGGYIGDVVYGRYGIKGKKHFMLSCGFIMGASAFAGGFYLRENAAPEKVHLSVIMGVFAVSVIFSEMGNGANFALVPHCNSYNNGFMSGLVGSFGNLGGVIFTLIARFQTTQDKAFWIVGLMSMIINALLVLIPVPKY